jgi:uncharacterized SAM-binding protein YcdF (DUF218 family)
MSISAVNGDFILVLCHFLEENGEIREEFWRRLEKAVQIQRQRPELIVVINGGQTMNTPRSQGRAAHDYLRDRGVPEENILWNEEAHDTFGELNLAVQIMREHGWKTPIVVSNLMQLMQVRSVFFRRGVKWVPAETPLCDRSALYVLQRFVAAILGLLFPDGKIFPLDLMRRSREKGLGQKI